MSLARWPGIVWMLILIYLGAAASCAGPETRRSEGSEPKADSLIKMGDVYFREGKYRNAMKHYLEADEIDPNDAELKFRIALIFADFYKKSQEAVRYYEEALALKENYSEAYNNLGTVYARQGQWDLAISNFKRALDNLFYPTPEKAYYNMASAYQGKGEYQKAIENYKMAIELQPEYIAPYLQLALLYQDEGRHRDAIDVLRRARSAMESNPPKKEMVSEEEWNTYQTTLASTYYQQALSWNQLGRDSEARKSLEKALEIAPEGAFRDRIDDELQSASE